MERKEAASLEARRSRELSGNSEAAPALAAAKEGMG